MMESYEKLEAEHVDAKPILRDLLLQLLKKVKRRLSTRETIRNYRKVNVGVDTNKLIYLKFYKAVPDCSSSFGREISLEKSKKGAIKQITNTFTHKGALQFHFGKFTDYPDIKYFF